MQIPINDPARLFAAFETEIKEAIDETLCSGRWLNGARVQAFAEHFASYLRVPFCLPVANGTDAIELAMRALLRNQRTRAREVITVANAGGYAVTACRQLGLIPVFADVLERSQLVDPESVAAALSEETALVVATHLYGGVVDVVALRRTIDNAGYAHVPILEDCAQAHGASLGGQKVGSLGPIAAFSFYPTKNLGAMGDAGAIVTTDPVLYETVKELHQYGWSQKYHVRSPGGRNSRMDEIQAAVLSVYLPKLDSLNDRRREILSAYRAAAPQSVEFLTYSTDTVAHLAIALCEHRDAFRDHMHSRRIVTDIHYPVLDCEQPGWTELPQRIGPHGMGVSQRSVDRIVTLPCFPLMKDAEVSDVIEALRLWGTQPVLVSVVEEA